jgi:hypothetical protein
MKEEKKTEAFFRLEIERLLQDSLGLRGAMSSKFALVITPRKQQT